MGEVAVGAVSTPAVPPEATAQTRAASSDARAAKLASLNAGLAKIAATQAVTEASTAVEPPPVAVKPEPIDPAVDAEVSPAETKPAPKADAPADPPDAKTAKALALIDKRQAEFRKEQASARAEIELERAELARLRTDSQSRVTAFEELQKLAKSRPLELLEKLGFSSEDDYALIGRAAYTQTKEGKSDPRSKPLAEQTARERALVSKLEEQERAISELRDYVQTRDKHAETRQLVNQFLDATVKAIPEAPTLIGKLHAKSPDKARQALLAVGHRLAQANDGEDPTHSEIIEAYESERRAELEEQGVDVDAMLRGPVAAPAPRKPPARTLDVGAPATGTRPAKENPSQAERLARINAGLRALNTAT